MSDLDLKQQLLLAIESSSMRTMFPKFCGAFRDAIEQVEVSDSDENALKLFIEIFRNPDEWLAYLAEHNPEQ